MPTIPDCDELFQRYFALWYSAEDSASRGFEATRPDMLQFTEHIGKSAMAPSRLKKDDQDRYIHHLAVTMKEAALDDFSNLLQIQPPIDFDGIQSIDDYYNLERIAELITESDPSEDGNPYFITCIELGTLIAMTLRTLVPDLEWLADSPYWESSLWHPSTGHIIPPTHWAIKKLSDYGCEDGLVPKIHCAAHVLRDEQTNK